MLLGTFVDGADGLSHVPAAGGEMVDTVDHTGHMEHGGACTPIFRGIVWLGGAKAQHPVDLLFPAPPDSIPTLHHPGFPRGPGPWARITGRWRRGRVMFVARLGDGELPEVVQLLARR